MLEPRTHPSALQEIRRFVAGDPTSHDSIPPWSTTGELMEHVYRLIHRHRDDRQWLDSFEGLVLALKTPDGPSTPWQALVERENLDALVQEIRRLPPRTPPRLRTLLQGMSVPAILGLSAMTMAVGCTALCPEAAGVPADEQETYCELVDYVKDAGRDDLLNCLPDVPVVTRDELVDLFASATADEIAEKLEEIAGEYCDGGGDDDDDAGH